MGLEEDHDDGEGGRGQVGGKGGCSASAQGRGTELHRSEGYSRHRRFGVYSRCNWLKLVK